MQTVRRILKSAAATCVVGLAAFTVLFLAPAQANAREASAEWVENFDPSSLSPDDAAPLRTRDDARQAAFSRAVFLEALDLLPGELAEPRALLLREYLRPMTGDFVQAYSELGETASPLNPEGRILTLDVSVDRRGLKRALKEIGTYYTVNAPREYELGLGGVTAEAWDILGRLQALSGLQVRNGVEPKLFIEFSEGIWKGTIEFDDTMDAATGEDLSVVWAALLSTYFSGPDFVDAFTSNVRLHVSGWYTPDGVRAFDRTLRSWDGALDGAELAVMDIAGQGVSAVWTLQVSDAQSLQNKLERYLPGRGLKWSLETGE